MKDITTAEYRSLAELRRQIRAFLHFSEEQVRAHGLEPQQHQLLLAIRGLPDRAAGTISELAGQMLLKHHSTVELIDRLERRGYVHRKTNSKDHRQIIVGLTRRGANVLRKLSLAHRQELESRGPELAKALRRVIRKIGQ